MAGILTNYPKTQLAVSVLASLFWLGVSIFLIVSMAGAPIAGYTLVLSTTAAWNVLGLLGLSIASVGLTAYVSPFWYAIKTAAITFFQYCKQGVAMLSATLKKALQGKTYPQQIVAATRASAPVLTPLQILTDLTQQIMLYQIDAAMLFQNPAIDMNGAAIENVDQKRSNHMTLFLHFQKYFSRIIEEGVIPLIQRGSALPPDLKPMLISLNAIMTSELKRGNPNAAATYHPYDLTLYKNITPAWLELLKECHFTAIDFTQAMTGHESDNTEVVAQLKNFMAALPNYPNITCVTMPQWFIQQNPELTAQINAITARPHWLAQYEALARDYVEKAESLRWIENCIDGHGLIGVVYTSSTRTLSLKNPETGVLKKIVSYKEGETHKTTIYKQAIQDIEDYERAVAALLASVKEQDATWSIPKTEIILKAEKKLYFFKRRADLNRDYQKYLEENGQITAQQRDWEALVALSLKNPERAMIVHPLFADESDLNPETEELSPPVQSAISESSLFSTFLHWVGGNNAPKPPVVKVQERTPSVSQRRNNIEYINTSCIRSLGFRTTPVSYQDMQRTYQWWWSLLHPDKNQARISYIITTIYPEDINQQQALRDKLKDICRDAMPFLQEIWSDYQQISNDKVHLLTNKQLWELRSKSLSDNQACVAALNRYSHISIEANVLAEKKRRESGEDQQENLGAHVATALDHAMAEEENQQEKESHIAYIRLALLDALGFTKLEITDAELIKVYTQHLAAFRSNQAIPEIAQILEPIDSDKRAALKEELETICAAILPLLAQLWKNYQKISTHENSFTAEEILNIKNESQQLNKGYKLTAAKYIHYANRAQLRKDADQAASSTDIHPDPTARQSPSHSELDASTDTGKRNSSTPSSPEILPSQIATAVGEGSMMLGSWNVLPQSNTNNKPAVTTASDQQSSGYKSGGFGLSGAQ